jgi:hypothetical protein
MTDKPQPSALAPAAVSRKDWQRAVQRYTDQRYLQFEVAGPTGEGGRGGAPLSWST